MGMGKLVYGFSEGSGKMKDLLSEIGGTSTPFRPEETEGR